MGGGVVLIIAHTADCRPHNALSGALWRFLSGEASHEGHKGYKRRLEAHGALGSVTVGDRGHVVAFVWAVGAQGRGEAQA